MRKPEQSKPAKKAAVKKAVPKSKPVKKVATKKAAPKKVVKVTAAETVFAVIKKSKKGVDTATLMEKTGFNRVKIANNVKVLKKKGLVKSPEKGVYVKA
jgi:hypothetical protein